MLVSCRQKEEGEISSEYNIVKTDSSKDDDAMNLWIQKSYEEYLEKVLKKELIGYKPVQGVIPDSLTAVKVAEIVLSNIYTSKTINEEKPFTAFSRNGYWMVYGSISGWAPGGVAEIVIKKNSGEIIYISHSE